MNPRRLGSGRSGEMLRHQQRSVRFRSHGWQVFVGELAVAIDERQALGAQHGGESGCLRQSIGHGPALADQVLALLRGEFVVI